MLNEKTVQLKHLLGALEKTLGMPVVSLAASWHDEYAANLDEIAVRVFFEVFEETTRQWPQPTSELAILILVRNGLPEFADGLRRIFESFDLSYHLYVPVRVDGVATLLALGAKSVVLHPLGSLGALDPLGRCDGDSACGAIDAHSLALLDGVIDCKNAVWDSHQTAQLAHQSLQVHAATRTAERFLATNEAAQKLSVIEKLKQSFLGKNGAISCQELTKVGLPARKANEQERALLWSIYTEYELELDLMRTRNERYAPLELADEVEFEPATLVTTAVIQSTSSRYAFKVDTGKPHPLTRRFAGHWQREFCTE